MAELVAHGMAVTTPPGWEGRIFVRPAHGEIATSTADGATAPPGERTLPLVHVATVALPEGTADYGDPAVEDLGSHDALVVLKEFDPSEAATNLFATEGVPRQLTPESFDAAVLQRTLAGQVGCQVFCREGGRAFCLYVVLGSGDNRDEVVPYVNAVLATLRLDPLPSAPTTTTPSTTAPLPSALDVVRSTADVGTFVALVDTAAVGARLGGSDPVTVFAPVDAAFTALGDLDALRADTERLRALLDYHVVPSALDAAAIDHDQAETTLEGHDVTLGRSGDTLVVNGVAVSSTSPAANGFVHVIDTVLTVPAP
jgi:uncharacterized surface protein with fasciclin (FAS1) repeats